MEHKKRKLNSPEVKKKKENKTNTTITCLKCNRKLRSLNHFVCDCGSIYCALHRHPYQHDCSFDYRKMEIDRLVQQNPRIAREKLNRLL